jgi:hypothetical protein
MRRLNTDEGRAKRQAHDRKKAILERRARQRRRERELASRLKAASAPPTYKPQGSRAHTLWKKYRMTTEQYDRLLASQDGGCAICGARPPSDRSLAVDHCHERFVIRGILCQPCNVGLGNFKDNPETMQKAIQYLRTHQEKEKAA